MPLNLWDPSHLSIGAALVTAVLLGLIHGVTPDEHTWPITFSYAVGSYSRRGGFRTGFLFSAAFTLQRAIAAELAFFALAQFQFGSLWNYGLYVVIGLIMIASGRALLRKGRPLRLEPFTRSKPDELAAEMERPEAHWMPRLMPLAHGFLAGWGVGAFALIIYTVLVPAMPSPWFGWVPGALFGLGTMVMQILLGGLVGTWMARRRIPEAVRAKVARAASARTLTGGGFAFVLVGLAGLVLPGMVDSLAVTTPIRVQNLDSLGVPFLLAVVVLFGVAVWALRTSIHEHTPTRGG